jgi:16S rRNA (guanine527-N7)-methyltransferase
VTDTQELAAGAAALGVELDQARLDRLVAFAQLLRRWNKAFNLVSRRDIGRLIARHVLDSLSLAPQLRGRRVLDLGTGAGLPGMPLAILRPQLSFTLVDRAERRIRFVQQVCLELEVSNVDAIAADFASVRVTAPFDTVVSRAVAKPAALWRVAEKLLASEGVVLLQVGAAEDANLGVDADVRTEPIRIPGIEQPQRIMTIRRINPPAQVDR